MKDSITKAIDEFERGYKKEILTQLITEVEAMKISEPLSNEQLSFGKLIGRNETIDQIITLLKNKRDD